MGLHLVEQLMKLMYLDYQLPPIITFVSIFGLLLVVIQKEVVILLIIVLVLSIQDIVLLLLLALTTTVNQVLQVIPLASHITLMTHYGMEHIVIMKTHVVITLLNLGSIVS